MRYIITYPGPGVPNGGIELTNVPGQVLHSDGTFASGGGGGGAEGTIPFTLSTGASGNFPLSGGGIQFTTQEGGVVTIPLG